jgi:hypothetical protein
MAAAKIKTAPVMIGAEAFTRETPVAYRRRTKRSTTWVSHQRLLITKTIAMLPLSAPDSTPDRPPSDNIWIRETVR